MKEKLGKAVNLLKEIRTDLDKSEQNRKEISHNLYDALFFMILELEDFL